jgi:hypothetical protein
MNTTNVHPSTLIRVGAMDSVLSGSALEMSATRAIHDVGYNIRRDLIHSYMAVPGLFCLPMQIDLSFTLDSPEALLLVGNGHISFGSPWMENRRIEDIAQPTGKPRGYDNSLPLGKRVNIRVNYNLNAMQILIDGEVRYHSNKEPYWKSAYFAEQNARGFTVAITATKRACLTLHALSIAQSVEPIPMAAYDAPAPPAAAPSTEKPTFESCIRPLSDEVQAEIMRTVDTLKSLPHLKFKRVIEKHGNKITYVESKLGISYALYLSGKTMHHSFQWYLIANGAPETWHRKANLMEAVLDEIAKTNPALADRVFYNLNECIGCRGTCLARTPYAYQGKEKQTCHGHVFLKMTACDFADVRAFFMALNGIAAN